MKRIGAGLRWLGAAVGRGFWETEEERRRKPQRWSRYWWATAKTLLAVSAVLLALVLLPDRIDMGTDSSGSPLTSKDERTIILQVAAGLVILLGVGNTARQIRELCRQNDLTRAAQVNERFGKAIEQLGDREREFVRIGGIYALEQVARDSAELWIPAMETLCAYVRSQKPTEPAHDESPATEVALDVQTAMTVIGRSENRPDGWRFDLHGAHLDGAHLREAHFEGADLWWASLRRAALMGVHFEGAELAEADLEAALLGGAHLDGADLREANLSLAALWRAHLRRAVLIGADLRGARLEKADLDGANLAGAIVTREQLATALNVDLAIGVDTIRSPGDAAPEAPAATDAEARQGPAQPEEQPEASPDSP